MKMLQWLQQDFSHVQKHTLRSLQENHIPFHNTGEFYMENGKLIPEDIVEEVVELLNEADSECQQFSHKDIAAPPELSVGRVFREKFLQYMSDAGADQLDRRELKKAVYHWVLRWITTSVLVFAVVVVVKLLGEVFVHRIFLVNRTIE